MIASLPGILIFGAGGHAKCVRDAVEKEGKHRVAAFVVDGPVSPNAIFEGLPIRSRGDLQPGRNGMPERFVMGIGDNDIRAEKTRAMEQAGFIATTVVHPFSNIGRNVKMGRGVVIFATVSIDPDVTLGDGVIVNVAGAIGHDSKVGEFSHVSAAAYVGANCKVGPRCFFAMRSTLISGPSVGRNVFVGAGALVTKDVPDDMLALGSPARFRRRQSGAEDRPIEAPVETSSAGLTYLDA